MSPPPLEKPEPSPGPPLEELPAFGAFELLGVLGEGGSGKVYAVQRDGQSLALKVMRADLALSARERRRFLDEAARMRRLAHRSIVPLVDSGTLEDGRPFLAMPLLPGDTLAKRLAEGRLDPSVALRYFADIADAVSAIHREGLIHRDIKPENVILSVEGGEVERCILLDLGIARDVSESASTTTEQGSVRGTRAYMAPERFFGVQASVSTDIYELGVLLYLMLVGESPWVDEDGAAGRLHPRDPVELGVAMPEALRTALLRALSTRPETRPRSVESFARDVGEATLAVAPNEPVPAPAATTTPPAPASRSPAPHAPPLAKENDDVAAPAPSGGAARFGRGVVVSAGAVVLVTAIAWAIPRGKTPVAPARVIEPPSGAIAEPPSLAPLPPSAAVATGSTSAAASAGTAGRARALHASSAAPAGPPAARSSGVLPRPPSVGKIDPKKDDEGPSVHGRAAPVVDLPPVPSASSSPERLYIDRK